MTPVAVVMWLKKISLVRGVMAFSKRSTISSAVERRLRNFHVVERDAKARGLLLERAEATGMLLISKKYFVPSGNVEAVDDDVVRFRGVAHESELVGADVQIAGKRHAQLVQARVFFVAEPGIRRFA